MSVLLDASTVVAIVRGRPPSVRDRLLAANAERRQVCISAIVAFELWYGAARSGRPQENEAKLRELLTSGVQLLPFTDEDAVIASGMRASLDGAGTPIGPYDLLIAAQALRSGATLVTANTSELARVPGLSWEDWTR